ncbi:HAMP domain-containing sensor histidine kinase [Pseudomonas profundi]|uniref:HAMP domain-containing sensor histidine kinase n=1 Tax=Pseudomonas profundi TaxID=1981513 RepID=UPI00123A3FE4|nr:HAMP domain-containing sensor histidine kinase [Pseudomonas profundi]
MRLFWKVFAVLWLATLLVGGSGFLVSRALQQDWLLLQFHPQLRDFSEQLIDTYEHQGSVAAQQWLETQRQKHRLRAQLYNDQGLSLLPGTLPSLPRFETSLPGQQPPARFRHGRIFQLAWNSNSADYQLTLNIPAPELFRWQRTPFALIANITLAMAMLALISLALSRYLTAPLQRLGQAAQQLAKGRFDASTLEHIGQRRDEIGDLARRFQTMGDRVQSLLDSQRQLMRDISHELRSPLARMRLGLAIGSKQELRPDDPLWQRLDKECTRLDRLIDDILTLSRLDTQDLPAEHFDLDQMVRDVVEDARFAAHGQQTLEIEGHTHATLRGWREQLSAALDNLLRNALRFSPADGVIRVRLAATGDSFRISVQDQGAGVPEAWLEQLGEPFVRLPDQPADSGHGLGLAIARRAVARHAGTLSFSSQGHGFEAVIQLDKS